MRDVRWDITAQIEDEQTEHPIDGSSLQLVSVILSDPPADPEDPPIRSRPPALVTCCDPAKRASWRSVCWRSPSTPTG